MATDVNVQVKTELGGDDGMGGDFSAQVYTNVYCIYIHIHILILVSHA